MSSASGEKRVLITGAAGFLGSHLTEHLLSQGYEVIGVDNLSQGREANLQSFIHDARFRFHELDVLDREALFEAGRGVQFVVHFAAYKIPRYYTPLKTLEINTHGTENALETARLNAARFIYGSTDDIYGKNPDTPFSEESALVMGEADVSRWSFAVSQMYAEHLCFAYHEKFGLPISILRYFGGYGPRQSPGWWGGPTSVFIESALKDTYMPIHGNGTQTRSFCYVTDMINGTINVMENPRAVGEIFNIGNPNEVSMIDLAYTVWGLSGNDQKPKLEFIDYTEFSLKYEDVKRKIPDITKARFMLGFEPKTSLIEGLRLTLEWHKIEGPLANAQP
ncbi:MAG: GDP-mannose 4,6-dehydratase [Acidobacteria bacterium]|nr:GDP-mannose 4,6-dehydratase [Acidobacteriota bacterium]MBI3655269.1 GDP-mannose 4,6-dehydratase [Acidobacteriota bacterium]